VCLGRCREDVQQVECALRTDSLRKIKELMKKNENLAEENKMATQAMAFSAPGVLETFELNMRACELKWQVDRESQKTVNSVIRRQ
jgi:hypothetical protein